MKTKMILTLKCNGSNDWKYWEFTKLNGRRLREMQNRWCNYRVRQIFPWTTKLGHGDEIELHLTTRKPRAPHDEYFEIVNTAYWNSWRLTGMTDSVQCNIPLSSTMERRLRKFATKNRLYVTVHA